MKNDVYAKRVKEVMSRDLVTIDAKDSVHEALQLMAENKVAALPVVDRHQRCIGILSTSDLVEVTREVDAGLQELEDSSVSFWGAYIDKLGGRVGHQGVMDLMSESVVSAGPDDALHEAASRMLCERVHRLPVVDGNDHLLGIVSMTDIMSAFVACSPAKEM